MSLEPVMSAIAAASIPGDDRSNAAGPAHRLVDREVRVSVMPAADAPAGRDIRPRPRSEWACRVANVVIATIALCASAPILVFVAILIKITSRGPVLYRQARIGLDRRQRGWSRDHTIYDRRVRDVGGRAFTIYKLRTMCVGAESGRAVWATRSDPRCTLVGRFLRKTRIDEIPQLWNVIRGDMNIVGPRPERPSLVVKLREEISDYSLRHRAKPGITGWAQINRAYDGSIDDVRMKVRFDLQYLERQCLAEDLMIMARTIPVMLLRRGAN